MENTKRPFTAKKLAMLILPLILILAAVFGMLTSHGLTAFASTPDSISDLSVSRGRRE